MENAPYWIAVITGLLVILVIYVIIKMKAKKQIPATTTEPFVGELTIDKYYEGDKSTIPYSDRLYVYLSSFSGIQSDHNTSVYSGSGVPMWRSLVNEDIVFSVIGTALPNTIEKGLPMIGVRLIGPPSENVAPPNTGYVLPSFTVAWYALWKSLNFDTKAPIILLRMFAENPNHVQLSVREVDANNVAFDAVVGNASTVHSWTIPKTTVITQGTGTLYSFVYNREERKITLAIGNTVTYSKDIEAVDIKLGNTPMDINFNQNWDADLKSFMYYRAPLSLTDMTSLTTYITDQASGKNLIMSSVDAEKAALEKTLQSCSLTDKELAALRDELNLTRDQLYSIKNKLRQCMNNGDIDPETFRRWEVKNSVYPGKYTNLNQCKELEVKDLDEIKSNLANTLIRMFAAPLKKAVTKPPETATGTGSPSISKLYTTFPNDSFKEPTTNQSIYIGTPYPEQPAKTPPPPPPAETQWKLNTLITQFGTKEPIAQASQIVNTVKAGSIPEAQLLPKTDTSVTGLKLLYADAGDPTKVTGAQLTTAVNYPTPTNSTPVQGTATITTTSTTDSLWGSLKSALGI